MGSASFVDYSRGKTIDEAYKRAVDEAKDEYGHQQGYSGAINCSTGYTDVTKKFKASGKDLNVFIKDALYNDLTKHNPCWAICIDEPVGNKNKVKSQVKHIVEPGTKKWVLRYNVVTGWHKQEQVGCYSSKGEAVKKARLYTEKNQVSTEVHMIKVLEKGKTLTAQIEYKKAPNEREGRWIFFGWASD